MERRLQKGATQKTRWRRKGESGDPRLKLSRTASRRSENGWRPLLRRTSSALWCVSEPWVLLLAIQFLIIPLRPQREKVVPTAWILVMNCHNVLGLFFKTVNFHQGWLDLKRGLLGEGWASWKTGSNNGLLICLLSYWSLNGGNKPMDYFVAGWQPAAED